MQPPTRSFFRSLEALRPTCLYYWRPTRGSNFGDELSWHITARLLERLRGSAAGLVRCQGHPWLQRRVFTLGSILHQCKPGDIVWGSGINGKIGARNYDFRGVDFRAVRGPLSRRMVLRNGGTCPAVYGDPGLLVPRLFPELRDDNRGTERFAVTYVGNINDEAFLDADDLSEVHYVSPTRDWKLVAHDLLRSDFVASSSLHGIVLADAFGIPCRPVTSLFESPFKYEDYFLATNRTRVAYARSWREALELGPLPKPDLDLTPLLAAFPSDAF